MKISLNTFQGIRPKIDPELLSNNEAQIATNVKLHKGTLRPWHNEAKDSDLEENTLTRTIFLFRDTYWLEFTADVDIVRAPIANDTAYKLYYTGDGIPKKTNSALAITGSGAMPINYYPLSLPSPKPAPTAGAPGAGGTGDARAVTYVWTIVSNWSEESLPSPASNVVSPKQSQSVALSGMTLGWQASTAYTAGEFVIPSAANGKIYKCVTAGTSGAMEPIWETTLDGDQYDNTATWRCFDDNTTYKRIYRLNTGDEFGSYQYLTQIAVADVAYTDTTADTDLGEALETETWDPPLDELTGLTYMGNGILAAFNGKDVYFCDPYHPWAWPTDYMITLTSTIVSIKSVGGSTLVILTETIPYIVIGTDPASMIPTPMTDSKPCVSKRGTVSATISDESAMKGQVVYPAPDGLIMIDGTTARVITKNYYDHEEWDELHPETMHGHIHDNKYFGFYSSGGDEGCIVVDFITGLITDLSMYADGAFVDPKTDIMYFIKSTDEVLLQEDGVSYPNRSDALLSENGDHILAE